MSRVLPILFNTEMVQAILAGRKTATRRVIKRQPLSNMPDNHNYCRMPLFTGNGIRTLHYMDVIEQYPFQQTRYFEDFGPYEKDDILYVRETWQHLYELDGNEQIIEGTEKYYYAATDTIPFDTYVDSSGITHDKTPWRPSIHMPKEAARIFLKVKDVRAERLQDITEKQAETEGINGSEALYDGYIDAREKFAELWDSTIKKSDTEKYGWSANPWVWVIEFERCEKPEEWK